MKHYKIQLCMDTMHVNECSMLTTVNPTMKFQSLVPMNTRQHKEYYRALDQILWYYSGAGFAFARIHAMENIVV